MKDKKYFFFAVVSLFLLAALIFVPCPMATVRLTNAGPNWASGQLLAESLPPLIVLTAQLTPANEIPPVTNGDAGGVGEAVVTLHVTQDSGGNITTARADFGVAVLDLAASDRIILSHIDQGAVGVAGPVVVDSGLSPGSPVKLRAGNGIFFRSNLAVSPTTAQALVANPSNFYFNVHTNANGGGAVRGQLTAVSTTTTPIVFAALLSPADEVPPVSGPDASGVGLAVVAVTPTTDATGAVVSATAEFDWVIAGLPSTDDIILSDIQQGADGTNGPVLVDSGISPSNPLAVGSAGSLIFTVSGLAVTPTILPTLITSPEGFYFNIHSDVNPEGVVRGQLAILPVITAVTLSGKNLLVTGVGFTTGSVLFVGGRQANTKNDPANLSTSLIGKKALKLIAPGGSADVEVVNPNGLVSSSFIVTRP